MVPMGGRCGVPAESERVYVGVEAVFDTYGQILIRTILWPGPVARVIPCEACSERRPVGLAHMGNLVRSWEVTLGRHHQRRIIYLEHDRWFVRRKGAAPPRASGGGQ